MKYKTKEVTIDAIEYTGDNGDVIMAFMGKEGEFNGIISTLEGDMKCSIGDFIIKGTIGEFYPCKPSVFHTKYVKINNEKNVICG